MFSLSRILLCFSVLSIVSLTLLQGHRKVSALSQETTERELTISQPVLKREEIPRNAVYEQLFSLVLSHEKEARKQETQGYPKRAKFWDEYFQHQAALTPAQAEILKRVAKSYLSQTEQAYLEVRKQPKDIPQNGKSNILQRRENIISWHSNHLHNLLGDNAAKQLEVYLWQHIASNMEYIADPTGVNGGISNYSRISYDADAEEVSSVSQTGGLRLSPTGCDIEKESCVYTETYAWLTEGDTIVDEDEEFRCGEPTEVYLYAPIPATPDTEYEVKGYHGYNPRYLPQGGGCDTQNLSYSHSSDSLRTLPAPDVTSLVFEAIDSPLDTNPNTTGGQRIFPDFNNPNDTVNRRRVRVRAVVDGNLAGRTVYFRNFDLDDPSTDAPPLDPNSNAGDDNRGRVNGSSAGQLNVISAPTNSNGIATVEFTVTMQPGDNFAVAASTDQNQLNNITVDGTELRDGSGNALPVESGTLGDPAVRTQMLTVWRRLHIEVDSMGIVQNNFVNGTFAGSATFNSSTPQTISINGTLDAGQFENGRLVVGTRSFRVIANTTSSITLALPNNPTKPFSITSGSAFTVYDDDDFNDNAPKVGGSNFALLNGDNGEDIPPPDLSHVQASDNAPDNLFAPAYIRPVYDLPNPNATAPFVLNVPTDDALGRRSLFNFDNITTEASTDFWTVYLLGAYQDVVTDDSDPDTDINSTGTVDAINGMGALIFLENNRFNEVRQPNLQIYNEAITVAHELAHLLNATHGDMGIMDDLSASFSDVSLDKIRATTHP